MFITVRVAGRLGCERLRDSLPAEMAAFLRDFTVAEPEHQCGAYFHYIASKAHQHAAKINSRVRLLYLAYERQRNFGNLKSGSNRHRLSSHFI